MIYMEFSPSTVVGLGLFIIGLLLYLLRTKRPDLSRDYDLFFSSAGLLAGGILFFQGWRLDPILLLSQILSSGTAIFFIGESLWLRQNNQKYYQKIVKKKKIITQNYLHINTFNNKYLIYYIMNIQYLYKRIILNHQILLYNKFIHPCYTDFDDY